MEAQPFAGQWVGERQPFGMEVEAVCRVAVERIAYDGTMQSQGVSRMDT